MDMGTQIPRLRVMEVLDGEKSITSIKSDRLSRHKWRRCLNGAFPTRKCSVKALVK